VQVYKRVKCNRCSKHIELRNGDDRLKKITCTRCGDVYNINAENSTYYIDYCFNHKRHREKVGSSKALAESVLAKRQTQIIEGKFFDIEQRPRIKLIAFAKTFISSYCKPNKISWFIDEYYLKKITEFMGDIYLDEITLMRVEEYKKHRLQFVKPATINREVTCLRTMMYKAVEWDLLKDNTIKRVKKFKEESHRLRFLERDEIERLLAHCNQHIKNIVIFALNTGMRRGEILRLKWDDIDFINDLIYVLITKNKEKRIIPMNSTLKQLLLSIKEGSVNKYVFCNGTGEIVKSVRTGFTNAMKRANINNFRFHDLRHTFASHLVMSGVDLNTVRELMGHKTIEMTLRYAHLSQTHKTNAVELLSQRIDTGLTHDTVSENTVKEAMTQLQSNN